MTTSDILAERRFGAPATAAFLLFTITAANALTLDGALTQGGLIRGSVEPGARVELGGRAIRVDEAGRFAFGFGRDAPATAELRIERADRTVEARTLEVTPRRWEVQRVDGLPPQTVTPDPAIAERIKRENEMVRTARRRDSDEAFFAGRFIWPVQGVISGLYGSQRILNGEPRQPHYGVDIAADRGTRVVAPAGGTVTLAEPDLFLTGGTIVIDHGHGVSTTYLHLQSVDVLPGDAVAQGQPIGTVGATGRATGPHLHWGADWFEVRLDPALLAGPMPEQKAAR